MLNTARARVTSHATGVGTDVAGPGKTITPALTPSMYRGERGKWDAILTITRSSRRGYPLRFGVGYVDETGHARRTHGGPVLPGPYAYAFGLGTAITADPTQSTAFEAALQRDGGTEHDVADGDLIRLGWDLFRVRYVRDQWIELDHVGNAL